MTLRDDLIAAKALIDTPEKWIASPGIVRAITDACGTTGARRRAVLDALHSAGIPHPLGEATHADIMALFDRAIEAAS